MERPQSSAGASTPTCNQLTKAEVQPLLADQITKVVVAPLTNERLASSLTNGKKIEGQMCNYAIAAVATLCNRIYVSGNTTPDFSGLHPVRSSTSTGGALPTNVTLPSDAPSPA